MDANWIPRSLFVDEVLTWVGTPFVDGACVKGRAGAVDCAMLLWGAAAAIGCDFPEPPPYPRRWFLRRGCDELLLNYLHGIGAREIERPAPGDVVVFQVGNAFSHCAVMVSETDIVHAWFHARIVLRTSLTEPLLCFVKVRDQVVPRPVKYFSVW